MASENVNTNTQLLMEHINNLPPDYIEQVAKNLLHDDITIAMYQGGVIDAWKMAQENGGDGINMMPTADSLRFLYTHAGGWFDNTKFVPAKQWEAQHGTLPNMKRWTKLIDADGEWVYTGDEVEPIGWQDEPVTYFVHESGKGGYCLIDRANNVVPINDTTGYQKVDD